MKTLTRLLYASTVTNHVDINDLELLLQQAQQSNRRHDITGMMAFDGNFFLQAIEGQRAKISQLYANLMHDRRHHTVALLSAHEIEERLWSDWSMGFANPTSHSREFFLNYSTTPTFNPYNMKSRAAEQLLVDLASQTHASTSLS
jgi:Sensors of blue-light using FAD